MKVVVSIGGSVLAPDLDPERIGAYADVIREVVGVGHDLGVVVGGGRVAREYIAAGRELGANEIELDQLGIGVTRLNARLLATALEDLVAPGPPETYEAGREILQRGQVPVLGGTEPAHTTDAVAAAFAEYVDADLLVYATSVPGVYTADPDQETDAERYDTLTADELVTHTSSLGMDAGAPAPVDPLGAKLIKRSGMPTAVLDGTDPRNVARAILEGSFDGTEVIPDDGVRLRDRLGFDG